MFDFSLDLGNRNRIRNKNMIYFLKLLQEEIRHKTSDIRFLKKEFNSSYSS